VKRLIGRIFIAVFLSLVIIFPCFCAVLVYFGDTIEHAENMAAVPAVVFGVLYFFIASGKQIKNKIDKNIKLKQSRRQKRNTGAEKLENRE